MINLNFDFITKSVWLYNNWKKIVIGIGVLILIIVLVSPDRKKIIEKAVNLERNKKGK